MRLLSPLRYPGGKACLSQLLEDVIDLNDLRGGIYYEPYAGGAGAALNLLHKGVVSEIVINDADVRVHAFWQSALLENERFVTKVLSVPLDINEWHKQRDICEHPNAHSQFDIGFAAFYMNRCNRSGVLSGAGPIGGYEQSGKWRLDVRFQREPLAERLIFLARMKDKINVFGLDALEFLKTKLPRGNARKNTLVYLDPPYVNKGQRLYLNSYGAAEHSLVAKYLDKQSKIPWIMSYDDTEFVRNLYASHNISFLPIRYSLQTKRFTNELIIYPDRLMMPIAFKVSGQEALLSTYSEGLTA